MQNHDMASIGSMKFDAIVVGTGPGGATVAKELSAKGKKVLILERGSGKPIRGTWLQYLTEQLIPGKSLLFTPDLLGMVRGLTIGGSSLFYYGTAFPVQHDALKKYGIDVREEEQEARKELPIGTLKKEMVTPFAARIMESGRRLGYDWNLLNKFMYQERWKPGYQFGYYGDTKNVKWSARMYAEEAVKNGAILLTRARVKNIILEGNRATGVEFKYKGSKHIAYASKIIIGAGGIGSPVILRRMGIQEAGYNYFYDPLVFVMGRFEGKGILKRKDEIPMTSGCIMKDEGIVMTDIALPWMLDMGLCASTFKLWKLLIPRKKIMGIMVKIRDDLSGRISKHGAVMKRLAPADKEKLRKGYEMARNVLISAGCTGIYKTWRLAAHPGGSVRIGNILDSNLKVKNFENVYVCDCSVIPEPFGLPPVLTIVCLGKRLSKHLLGEKKKSAAPVRKKETGGKK
jgi:choline dehydrogenase-like flavoprotein